MILIVEDFHLGHGAAPAGVCDVLGPFSFRMCVKVDFRSGFLS